MQVKLLSHSKYFFPILIFLLLISCKKDKLDGDPEILVGKWNWAYTIYEYDKCQQNGGYSKTLNPTTENITYQMEFFKKGKVKFYENDIEKSEYRIILYYFKLWNEPYPFPYTADPKFHFGIYLDNDKNQNFYGIVTKDSVSTFIRPFQSNDSPCSDYKNCWGK